MSGRLLNSGELQNNTANGAMSITINRVIKFLSLIYILV